MKLINRITIGVTAGALITTGLTTPAHATSDCSAQVLTYGANGQCVREAQQLLANKGFQNQRHVTGYYRSITEENVREFQRAHNIRPTGSIGSLTWLTLKNSQATSSGNISPETHRLIKAHTRVVDVNQNERIMRVFENGKLRYEFNVALGGQKINPKTGKLQDYTSDNGVFAIGWKSRDHKSRLFNNAPMPYALFYNGGEAIHFSPTFARNGSSHTSHGCVNIGDESTAKELFSYLKVGDPVVVHGTSPVR